MTPISTLTRALSFFDHKEYAEMKQWYLHGQKKLRLQAALLEAVFKQSWLLSLAWCVPICPPLTWIPDTKIHNGLLAKSTQIVVFY